MKFPIYALLLLIFPQGMHYSVDQLRALMALALDAKTYSAIVMVIVLLTLWSVTIKVQSILSAKTIEKESKSWPAKSPRQQAYYAF